MSIGSDLRPSEVRGKVLKFPGAAPMTQKKWPGIGPAGWALTAFVVCLVAATAAGIWALSGGDKASYATAPVTRGDVVRSVTAAGTVNPELTVMVGTYVSGVIQSLSCDYNTRVQAGQVCAKIDPRPFQAAVDRYTGQLLRDRAILGRDQKILARHQQLAAQNSIARQQADDEAYVVEQDKATVMLDQALLDNARLNLGHTSIVSPIDGTVVSRNVTLGQAVAASFQTPTLFLIASDLKKMQIGTNVSESDIGGIKERDTATFTVDAFPRRVFNATVSQIRQSPQRVQNVVTYDVVLSVDNADLALKPGMTAAVKIVVDRRTNVIRVPDWALRYRPPGAAPPVDGSADAGVPGQGQVWVLRNGKVEPVAVVLGLDDDTNMEIVSGALAPGDLVITGEQDAAHPAPAPSPRL